MKKLIVMSALAVALSVAATADASAWTRNGTITGPRGTSTIQGSGSCANGTCSRAVTATGPNGNTVTRQGSATCAYGVCAGSRQTTGPRGNTVYRRGVVIR